MKNTVLKFKSENIGDIKVRDYFSKNIRIDNITTIYPELAKYFKMGNIVDNGTAEGVTNELYSNVNLWDLILLINNLDPLFGMPYDIDALVSAAEQKMERYLETHPKINISDRRKEEIYEEFFEEIRDQNEKNRRFNLIDPKFLNNVITKLRQEGII